MNKKLIFILLLLLFCSQSALSKSSKSNSNIILTNGYGIKLNPNPIIFTGEISLDTGVIFSSSNISISNSSYQCTSSDKLSNISIINGNVTGVCTADITGTDASVFNLINYSSEYSNTGYKKDNFTAAAVSMTSFTSSGAGTATTTFTLTRSTLNNVTADGIIITNAAVSNGNTPQYTPTLRFTGSVNTSSVNSSQVSTPVHWKLYGNNTNFNQTQFMRVVEYNATNISIQQDWVNMSSLESLNIFDGNIKIKSRVLPDCTVQREGYFAYNYTLHKPIVCNSTAWNMLY